MSWIFVYGSLIWDLPFEYEERAKAVLEGYHRDFNKKSTRNWGTPGSPGPVLGLEPGDECEGMAFRIADETIDGVIDKIDSREGPSYDRNQKEIQLEDGREVTAIVWINDRDRSTYIGDENIGERARMAVNAVGEKGSAKDYALRTREELKDLNIDVPHVEELVENVLAQSE